METLKKIQPGGFYLLESRSGANSCYFENEGESKHFHKLFDGCMSELVRVYEYLLLADGWFLAVKIKDEDAISAFWEKKQKRKQTRMEKKGIKYVKPSKPEYWKIISEEIRSMLSRYVRWVNKERESSGTLVHSSYKRHMFMTKTEALEQLDNIRKENMPARQKLARYYPSENLYIDFMGLGEGHLLRCSKRVFELGRIERVRAEILEKCMCDGPLTDQIVSTLVEETFRMHHPHQNTS